MIRQAALYLSTADDLQAARLPVAGQPVAFRAIVAALRAGARRVGVPAVLRSPGLEAALATSPRARVALTGVHLLELIENPVAVFFGYSDSAVDY